MREMTSFLTSMSPAMRQQILRHAGITLAAGTVLAILAPWGTRYIGWPGIWIYWTGLIAFGWGAVQAACWPVRKWAPNLRPLLANVLIGALASVPITIAVQAIGQIMFGFTSGPVSWMINYFYVGIITAIMITLSELVQRARIVPPSDTPNTPASSSQTAQDNATTTEPNRTPQRDIKARLPWHLQDADILAVASEDHYVRVHTNAGDCLILMRLADAISELAHIEGRRVHRSWWVAANAVAQSNRDTGRITLTLTGGQRVPVSRTYAQAVKDAGWLDKTPSPTSTSSR